MGGWRRLGSEPYDGAVVDTVPRADLGDGQALRLSGAKMAKLPAYDRLGS
jgi:hypothetical protein